MDTPDPLRAFLDEQGTIVLDGGLASELEARGHDLSDDLWSARLLLDAPEAIAEVHQAYLEAGADCVVSAQLPGHPRRVPSPRGGRRRGSRERLRLSVGLARRSPGTAFWRKSPPGRLRPLVAASVGPYGAACADGSEYTGRYDRDESGLREFHAERFALLADAGADLLACETLPSRLEARVLLQLLDETPDARAWFSFTARDGTRISDGSPIGDVARELDHERVLGIGVNCVPPSLVPELLQELAGRHRPSPRGLPELGRDLGRRRETLGRPPERGRPRTRRRPGGARPGPGSSAAAAGWGLRRSPGCGIGFWETRGEWPRKRRRETR